LPDVNSETPRPQGGASRQGNLIFCMVPLDPGYPARAGRGTFRSADRRRKSLMVQLPVDKAIASWEGIKAFLEEYREDCKEEIGNLTGTENSKFKKD
jgi:hypothetical protein